MVMLYWAVLPGGLMQVAKAWVVPRTVREQGAAAAVAGACCAWTFLELGGGECSEGECAGGEAVAAAIAAFSCIDPWPRSVRRKQQQQQQGGQVEGMTREARGREGPDQSCGAGDWGTLPIPASEPGISAACISGSEQEGGRRGGRRTHVVGEAGRREAAHGAHGIDVVKGRGRQRGD